MPQSQQPFLHELVAAYAAPTQLLSRPSGLVDAAGGRADGLVHADVRVLSRMALTVDDVPPAHLASEVGGGVMRIVSVLRGDGDPQVRIDQRREVTPGRFAETIQVSSLRPDDLPLELAIELKSDQAPMAAIKEGREVPAGAPEVDLDAPGAEIERTADRVRLRWPVVVPAHGATEVSWGVSIDDAGGAVVAAAGAPLVVPSVNSSDHRLGPWLTRSVEDLNGLAMATPEAPADTFFAAGVPWYLTLFGRDSLWAARMVLPLSLEPALGTLRVLAARQGRRDDPDAAEQPGKILHELRRGRYTFGGVDLPPVYYGTIDATPLWICLLHDAWRAGLPETELRPLLPHLQAALGWLTGALDERGFLTYLDPTGHGLSNQGWKDSADSVRFADGRFAEGPVALCEVQGYAYEAAVAGAVLLEAFGLSGADLLRAWAADLADRFRAAFWCGEGDDRYPALALDGNGERVDALTSNIGHLPGTGLLSPDEERLVARRVSEPALDSGLGLRTMADTAAAYSPLSYHCGSVWPHDTAITIAALHRSGLGEHAAGLTEGLLRAAVAFDHRLPELWSGEGRPVPYPASCRPQAWSAAAAVVVADVLGALT